MLEENLNFIDKELNAFFQEFDAKSFAALLRDLIPIVEMYDLDESGEAVIDKVLDGDQQHKDAVVMIRTAYLISRLCDFHAGKLLSLRLSFKGLWKRLEDKSKK